VHLCTLNRAALRFQRAAMCGIVFSNPLLYRVFARNKARYRFLFDFGRSSNPAALWGI
jgi:hypothetical protein